MKQSKAVHLRLKDADSKGDKVIGIFTLLALALPFLLHLIPVSGPVPIGAKLIPLFYAPFIAVLFFRFPIAIVLGVLGPVLNVLFFGKPGITLVAQLSTELLLFVLLAHVMKSYVGFRWVNAPLAFIGAKLGGWAIFSLVGMATALSYTPVPFTQAVSIAAPGLAILWALNVLLVSYKNRQAHGKNA